MAACILTMLFVGVGMVSTVNPTYLRLLHIHEPLGVTILFLVVLRLIVRWRRGAPPLPADLPEPMRLAAHLSHYALYALMIIMPLIGWSMLSAGNIPLVVFGVPVPSLLAPNPPLHSLLRAWHGYLAFAFFALILMHLAAALFHGLIRRDGVFSSMAP
jgi:cytochrome b561